MSQPLPTDMPAFAPRATGDAPTDPGPPGQPPPPAAPPPDSAGTPFGRYLLLSELGRGGMGVVWKAWDTQLRRTVALKLVVGNLDPVRVERFLREARAAARLSHPGIVAVHDVGEVEGQPYFTADCVEGRSLDRVREAGLTMSQSLVLVKGIAEALAYAHAQGIVHRDVKPANVLVDAEGRPHVMDFGLAREVDRAERETLTLSGQLLGTPAFMSPELAAGEGKEAGPASDQFSLGVVLYEMLTGKRPFERVGVHAMIDAVLNDDPEPPSRIVPRLPRDVETVCMKALEKEPERRYASMTELAADLGRCLENEPIRARPVPWAVRLARRAAKRRAVVIPSTLAVVLAIGLAAWFFHSRAQRERDRLASDAALEKGRLDAGAAGLEAGQRALEKGRLVMNVLARWAELETALREMEGRAFDDRLRLEEKRAPTEGWAQVQAFIDATPADATSQATMRPLAGWALCLRAETEEGLRWIASGIQLDSDVPYGPLAGAIFDIDVCLADIRFPTVWIGTGGLSPGPPPEETPRAAKARARTRELLAQATGAKIWGKEAGEEGRAAIEGIDALQSANYARAEERFTRAIGSAALRPFRRWFLSARGMACYLREEPEQASADLAEVVRARPGQAYLRYFQGRVALLAAMQAWKGGRDPSPALGEALDRFQEALSIQPGCVDAHCFVGNTLHWLAAREREAGKDPRATLGRALQAYDEAVRQDVPGSVSHFNRGIDREELASEEEARGIDPLGRLEAAVADMDEAARRDPASSRVRHARSEVLFHLAQVLAERGQDPREAWARGLSDAKALLAEPPEHPELRRRVAEESLKLADEELKRGADSRPALAQAIEQYDRLIELDSADAESLASRGYARMRAAKEEEARGEGPGEALPKGLEDLVAADRLRPGVAKVTKLLADGRAWAEALAKTPRWARLSIRALEAVQAGDVDRSRTLYEEAIRRAGEETPADADLRSILWEAHYNLACVYVRLSAGRAADEAGRLCDAAFERLARAIDLGYRNGAELRADADLEPLRSDPRWQALSKRLP